MKHERGVVADAYDAYYGAHDDASATKNEWIPEVDLFSKEDS